MSRGSIVIVGGSHAAAQLCTMLVEAGAGSRVHLVSAEEHLPYHRPPLSKGYLKSDVEPLQFHRAEAWFAEHGIRVHFGCAAVSIDRGQRLVLLASGECLGYEQLVLATGTRARRLPALAQTLANVGVLRDAADATALRQRLGEMRVNQESLTVLGGGFIGLEVATTARYFGLPVEILEGAPRLLARSASAELADHVKRFHEDAGIKVRLGVRVDRFEISDGRLVALSVDGVRQPVDQLVLGIGAEPNTSLAETAGLEVHNGIVVDRSLRTSDPAVLAIGDCASFLSRGGTRVRLESVQNANDQARTAAAVLLGRDEAYSAVPWFWSEQGALRLQMAGTPVANAVSVRRQGSNPQSYSLFHYQGDQLAWVESVNAPVDHMMSRKLLEAGRHPLSEQVSDPAVPLKSLL